MESYEAVIDLTEHTDEEIPKRRDAIKRLAALKKES